MQDTISRKLAIEALGEEPLVWDDASEWELASHNQWKLDVEAIKNLPSAESETIRCKDCKWFERHEEGLEYFGRIYDGECNLYCQEESQPFDEDGFCSNAERRVNG